MPTRDRRFGEFCWINIMTPQPSSARVFFASLLGWAYDEMPGLGHLVLVGRSPIGGLFDLDGPGTPPGVPPHIGVMVKVADADAIGAKAAELGGRSRPAFDVMDNGRMACCHDPNGAAFDVWQPRQKPGTDVDSTLHGAPSWFETLTSDTGRAGAFYTGLFGWQVEPMDGSHYLTFRLGDDFVGGMMRITADMGDFPPHWGVYFTVDDVDAAERQARELGATICVPAQDVPGVGRFCGVISPQGVSFYMIRYAA